MKFFAHPQFFYTKVKFKGERKRFDSSAKSIAWPAYRRSQKKNRGPWRWAWVRTNLQSSSLPVGGSSILLNSSIRFRESVCRMHFQTNVTTQRSYPAALGSSLFCSLEPLVHHCPVGGARVLPSTRLFPAPEVHFRPRPGFLFCFCLFLIESYRSCGHSSLEVFLPIHTHSHTPHTHTTHTRAHTPFSHLHSNELEKIVCNVTGVIFCNLRSLDFSSQVFVVFVWVVAVFWFFVPIAARGTFSAFC